MLANGNAWEREKCPSLITVAKFMPSYDGTTARPSYDTESHLFGGIDLEDLRRMIKRPDARLPKLRAGGQEQS